jgi:ATP synthase protein I
MAHGNTAPGNTEPYGWNQALCGLSADKPTILSPDFAFLPMFQTVMSQRRLLTHFNTLSMVRAASGAVATRVRLRRVEGMANGAHGNGNQDTPSDEEARLSARLQRLGDRLAKTSRTPEQSEAPRTGTDPSALARGFRLSTELVAGVLVGAVIGWLLDRWLGISPWGMIVFLLLGFTAGVLNVMRAAGVVPDDNRTD